MEYRKQLKPISMLSDNPLDYCRSISANRLDSCDNLQQSTRFSQFCILIGQISSEIPNASSGQSTSESRENQNT